jgi:hypothetical protein
MPRSNDVVLVPEGYHPVTSPPGYTTYYLNVLAGSAQSLTASDDPDFAWVKDSFQSRDPRVPLYSIFPEARNSAIGWRWQCANREKGETRTSSNTTHRRLTMAQAVIAFLKNQYVERDGLEQPFSPAVLASLGTASWAASARPAAEPRFPLLPVAQRAGPGTRRIAYAKVKNRLQTLVCTSSIGPGATNMITGAATATINRLPVLLLPGDIFARRNVAPVLQQLESAHVAGYLGQRLLQAGQQVLGPHQPPRPDPDWRCPKPCAC